MILVINEADLEFELPRPSPLCLSLFVFHPRNLLELRRRALCFQHVDLDLAHLAKRDVLWKRDEGRQEGRGKGLP